METRDSVAIVLPAAMFGDTARAAVDAHQDLTRHNGCFTLTERGWSCAVCESLVQGDSFFRPPLSGVPPTAYFEQWPQFGYVWSDAPREGGV